MTKKEFDTFIEKATPEEKTKIEFVDPAECPEFSSKHAALLKRQEASWHARQKAEPKAETIRQM